VLIARPLPAVRLTYCGSLLVIIRRVVKFTLVLLFGSQVMRTEGIAKSTGSIRAQCALNADLDSKAVTSEIAVNGY